jgi:hypothetical protein
MGRVLLAGLAPERLETYFRTQQFVALTDSTVTDPRRVRSLIEECRKRIVFAGLALEHLLGVTQRQNTLRTGEPHERYDHPDRLRRIPDPLDVVYGAGWKGHRELRLLKIASIADGHKAREFLRRLGGAADTLALRKGPGQQARCLKEFEFVTPIEQSFF